MSASIDAASPHDRDHHRPWPQRAETVSSVHLAAMREHHRKAALLECASGCWRETPDWRLDRHVIRLGLYLRERVGLVPGERIAILSPMRREWLVADWSAAVQGAAAVAIDADLPDAVLAWAIAQTAPRAAFVSGPAALDRLEAVRDRAPGLEKVIAFEGPPSERAALFSEVLDLGGTLDTPERAGAFRAQARDVHPDACALGYLERRADGSAACQFLSHREVIERLRILWSREPAREGDLAYVAASAVTLDLRLAALAFVGDGYTTTALGTPGREVEEIAAIGAHKIVVAPEVLDAAVKHTAFRSTGDTGVRAWLQHAVRRMPLARGHSHRQEVRAALGGRARWIHPTRALDPAISRRLRDVVTLDGEEDDPKEVQP